jgi:hypothetical protein
MSTNQHQTGDLGLAGKIGVALFALWGVLHLWVGFEGLHQYLVSPASGQWKMFIGGSKAPISAFSFPTDPTTIHVHANLLLNFCLDVAGYGILGIFWLDCFTSALLGLHISWECS